MTERERVEVIVQLPPHRLLGGSPSDAQREYERRRDRLQEGWERRRDRDRPRRSTPTTGISVDGKPWPEEHDRGCGFLAVVIPATVFCLAVAAWFIVQALAS